VRAVIRAGKLGVLTIAHPERLAARSSRLAARREKEVFAFTGAASYEPRAASLPFRQRE
jgi:hypothetical protein